jgi:SOS-response transcriptional repressor LexA
MEKLKSFEHFKFNETNMIIEELKLPSFQDTIKRKLSFLKSMDLSELEPTSTHQIEIKELWRKIMKKIYTKDKAGKFIEIVDNSTVHNLDNTLEMTKKIKDSVVNKKPIGYLIYSDKNNKFYYEKPITP